MARRNKKGRGSTKKKRGRKLLQQQSPVAPVAAQPPQPQQEAPMFRFDGDTNRQPEPNQLQSVVDDSAPIFRFGAVPNNNNEEGAPNITTTTTQAPTSVKVSEDACDQQIKTKEVHPTNTKLRFAVGDKVDCHNCKTEEWEPGTVIFTAMRSPLHKTQPTKFY